MFHHQVYAQIKNEIVQNIVVCANYEMANIVARNIYGKDAIAVECTYWDCEIGDSFRNNTFYDKDGNERNYKGSEAENITILQQENESIKQESLDNYESLIDTQFALEQAKDDLVGQMEAQLDLEFRVSQLEDSMEV